METNKIPSVNLLDFLSSDINKKNNFVESIGKAFEEIGFVALDGHFLDSNFNEKLYKEIRSFFDLPQEIKNKYEIPGISGQRGYVSFGKESAKGSKHGDLKEFWHFGQYVENDDKLLKESKEIIEDLIVAAHNDAKSKLKKKTNEEISKITGGIDLPPGFKIPF